MEKMIKVKKPKNKTNYNEGYKIVEVSEFLAEQQFQKSEGSRHPEWKGVTIATEADVREWGQPGEKLEVDPEVKLLKEQVTETAEINSILADENERLRKELEALQAKKSEKVKETKASEVK